jgi:hypothetical protein
VASIDLARLRAERLRHWHLPGNPVADAGEAVAGTKRGVPAHGDAAGHPLYRRYVELRHHPRVARLVVEAPVLGRRHALVVRDHMVDFARLLTDPPLADRRTPESRALAARLLAAVADRGPQSKRALRLAFARGSGALGAPGALDRALLDLETRLRLITVDHDEKEGASYDLFARAQRSLAIRAARQTRAESLDHLVERYVRSAIVVELGRVREVMRGIASAGEVRESLARLVASGRLGVAREAGAERLVALAVLGPPALLGCGPR